MEYKNIFYILWLNLIIRVLYLIFYVEDGRNCVLKVYFWWNCGIVIDFICFFIVLWYLYFVGYIVFKFFLVFIFVVGKSIYILGFNYWCKNK